MRAALWKTFGMMLSFALLLGVGACQAPVPSDEEMLAKLSGNATLSAITREGSVVTSEARGLMPLLNAIDGKMDLRGARCYDRMVGRSAAFLYVRIAPAEVITPIASEGAVLLLQKHGITCRAGKTIKEIRNHENTGMCPMEASVADLGDDEVIAAEKVLRDLAKKMKMALRK